VDFYHSDYSPEDRLAMFERARVVVGLHGGAIYHLMCCRPGTLFVEMTRAPKGTGMMAGMIGLDFWYLEIDRNGCVSLPSLDDILDSWSGRRSDKVGGVKESVSDESYDVGFYPEIISL